MEIADIQITESGAQQHSQAFRTIEDAQKFADANVNQ